MVNFHSTQPLCQAKSWYCYVCVSLGVIAFSFPKKKAWTFSYPLVTLAPMYRLVTNEPLVTF